jgi:hypothetical protein
MKKIFDVLTMQACSGDSSLDRLLRGHGTSVELNPVRMLDNALHCRCLAFQVREDAPNYDIRLPIEYHAAQVKYYVQNYISR